MINVNDIPAVRALADQGAGAANAPAGAPATSAAAPAGGPMVQVAEIPAVRALLERGGAAAEPEFARAPAGNGHEAALRQRGGAR